MAPFQLVPSEVSAAKLAREITEWRRYEEAYRQRGWLLLRHRELTVQVAFAAPVMTNASTAPLPVITACLQLAFHNYDFWPPSLTFIDLFTGQPCLPHVRAMLATDAGPADLLGNGHPETKLPFLCLPGTREYHSHPQHSGDSWLLHRAQHSGSLATICDRVWRSMARNVFGVRVTTQSFPPPLPPAVDVRLWQGDVDALRAQVPFLVGPAG